MARYHFNVEDGVKYPDIEGSEHDSLEAAREHAIIVSNNLLRENGGAFWQGEGWKVSVTNDGGLVLFTLLFQAVNSPATNKYGSRLWSND